MFELARPRAPPILRVRSTARRSQLEQREQERVDLALVIDVIGSRGACAPADANRQKPPRLIQRKDVFVRVVVADIDSGIAAEPFALPLQSVALVRSRP